MSVNSYLLDYFKERKQRDVLSEWGEIVWEQGMASCAFYSLPRWHRWFRTKRYCQAVERLDVAHRKARDVPELGMHASSTATENPSAGGERGL